MIKKEILEKVITQIIEGEPNIINTGFCDLDFMLSNVDYGSLITISGRPAMGKTVFLLSVMLNLLSENKKCLLFSVEMGAETIIKRLLSLILEVSLHKLRCEGTLNENIIKKLYSAKDKLSSMDVSIYEDVFDINKIKAEIETNKPEFVFIDSSHLLDNFDNILPKLKSIAKENNCVIFNTCKITDKIEEREDKRPVLSDLRDTGKADIVSDVVIYLYRDCYYNFVDIESEDYNYEDYKADLIIAKNKNGATGQVTLLYKRNIPKFYNYSKTLLNSWINEIEK